MTTLRESITKVECPVQNPVHRWALLIGGCLFVALGVTGIFVPLLPTTIFLILAAWCFTRSSTTAYRWLLNSKLLGKYLRYYLAGGKMPMRAKVITAALIVATVSVSIYTIWG